MSFSKSRLPWCVASVGLVALACGGDGPLEPLDPDRPTPAAIASVSGDGQEGKAGEMLGEPFVVRVTDAQGEGVAGVEVIWRVASGAGHLGRDPKLSMKSMDTNPDGLARVFFSPAAVGTSTVDAEVTGLQGSPVIFTTRATVTVIRFLYDPMFGFPVFESSHGFGSVKVPVGTTVEWAWDGEGPGVPEAVHIVSTSVPPGGEPFDSGILRPGGRFQFTPGVAGTWEYEERLHGSPTTGTLTVQ